ncbi:MAG: phytoene desaturase, partial [Balneolaceae bacterium]|nr:phytoene desaturase [Balneolaceae bacterium]
KLDDGTTLKCDLLFSNSDATETIVKLLPDQSISKRTKSRQQNIEPSCSGFVLILGCKKRWADLKHHNIYFSSNYRKEFTDIFENKKLPEDPTIYVANTSYSDSEHAPDNASNLFILINAPYLSETQDWDNISSSYSNFIIHELEKRGLKGLSDSIDFQKVITPMDFYAQYRSNKGSIYGTSSNNKFSAFIRPRNKMRKFKNLYLVGGSTHPGGGIPLVVQSAFNAVELLDRQVIG